MQITVLTLFPNIIKEYISTSIIKNAIDKKLVTIDAIDLRNYGIGKRKNVDDTVYGGGDGMIITVAVLDEAIKDIKLKSGDSLKIIYMSPKGRVFNQGIAKCMATEEENILFIAGHYEGIDERIFELYNIEEISIGDYILTGGELPAMVVIDSITRLVKGVIKEGSTANESHNDFLLEEPQYTKPSSYKNIQVPEILISGNHQKIDDYRYTQKIKETYSKRPDLLNKHLSLNNEDQDKINKILNKKEGK